MDRKQRREAALLLYQQAAAAEGIATWQGFGTKSPTTLLERYQKRVDEAREEFDQVAKGAALRSAVDELLPGWVDIEIACYTEVQNPPPMSAFISNSKSEWRTFLYEYGVGSELNHVARAKLIDSILNDPDHTWPAEDPGEDAGESKDAAIARLTAEVEMWKKRAAQHGCNVEEGDHECG